MLQKSYTNKLRTHMLSYASKRREIIQQSDTALHNAKRAIFALHRDDLTEATQKLKQAEKIFKELGRKYAKNSHMKNEGAYKAALEEYVEARSLYSFLTGKNIGQIKGLDIAPDVYIAGLCDLPGELHRYSIKAATEKDIKTVKKCATMAQDIVGELIEFNLTKYLRTKFDQAKRAVQKIEEVVYEVSLRETK